MKAKEGTEKTLTPSKSARDIVCVEILWFKYHGRNNYSYIVHHYEDETFYYGKYCDGQASPCKESAKLVLTTATGKLTIHDLKLSDEDDYYYLCNRSGKSSIFELQMLEIYGKYTWLLSIHRILHIFIIALRIKSTSSSGF